MSGPIVCVSPNTSTDRVSIVEGFVPGGTFRTVDSFDQAGGSGSHAASVVAELGGEALAIVAIGGGNGERWMRAAERQGLPYATIELRNENRSSFVLVDRELGKIAEVIDPGPELDAVEVERLTELVHRLVANASLVVLSGSLPPGVPPQFYAHCIGAARAAGRNTLVDTHSGPLVEALATRPWAIKPNLHELHQLMGVSSTTMGERIGAVRRLVRESVNIVLLSMEAEGAILGTPEAIWRLMPPADPVTLPGSSGINPVGCGDALVGAFARHWVDSGDLIASATWGLAAAHVNLGRFEVPSAPLEDVRRLVDRIEIQRFDVADPARA
jgi:1-phosphofructokinase